MKKTTYNDDVVKRSILDLFKIAREAAIDESRIKVIACLNEILDEGSTKCLDFSSGGLDEADIACLVKALMFKTHPQSLTLGFSSIGGNVIVALDELLRVNVTLHSLHLHRAQLDATIMNALAAALRVNTGLQHLDLSFNKLNNATIAPLIESLKVNTTLNRLNLANNRAFDVVTVKALAEVLRVNPSMRHLNIGYNCLGGDALAPLIEVLKVNTSLQILNLEDNRLNSLTIAALSEVLMVNNSLHRLNLASNDLDDDAITPLFTVLRVNTSLHRLNLDDNNLQGSFWTLLEVLKVNLTLQRVSVEDDTSWYDRINTIVADNCKAKIPLGLARIMLSCISREKSTAQTFQRLPTNLLFLLFTWCLPWKPTLIRYIDLNVRNSNYVQKLWENVNNKVSKMSDARLITLGIIKAPVAATVPAHIVDEPKNNADKCCVQ